MMEDMVQPRYDVSGTSQRTKSHRCAFQHPCEANVCTPRPTSSRVTTADGRSPGSRVVTLRRLPRTEIPQWHMTKDSPLTVAGAAAALGEVFPAPHSLLIPKEGTVTISKDHVTLSSQSGRFHAGALSRTVPEKQRSRSTDRRCPGVCVIRRLDPRIHPPSQESFEERWMAGPLPIKSETGARP